MKEHEAEFVEKLVSLERRIRTAFIPGIIILALMLFFFYTSWQRGCTLFQQIPQLFSVPGAHTAAATPSC